MVDQEPAGALAIRPARAVGGLRYTPRTDWRVVVEAFLSAHVTSPHTRRAYRRHLAVAFAVMGAEAVADLTGPDLAAYRAAVLAAGETRDPPLAPASQAQALAALRSFLRWSRAMGAHHLSSDVVVEALSTPRAVVRRPYVTLSDPEIAAMFAAARTDRDRALLAVLLGGGLRVGEVVGLDVRDLLEDHQGAFSLFVRLGKGRKDRTVPVQPDVAVLIRRSLAATGRRLGELGPLFRAHDRGAGARARPRLSEEAVGVVVTTTARRAGVDAKRVTPHSLRHTYAIRALENGADVMALAKLLGHASIATTQRYVDHRALSALRGVVPRLPIPSELVT